MGHWILSSHVSLKASIRVSVAASNVPDMEETIFQTTKQIFSIYDIYIYMIHMIPWNYTYYGTNHILNKPYVKVLQKTKTKSNTIPSVRWVSDFWWWRAHTSGDEHQTQWVHKGNYEGCYRSLAGGFLALPEMNQSRKDHHRISWMEINTIWNRPAKICARRWFLEWIAVILKNQMWWNQR